MGAPSLPMGIHCLLADDLPPASANVHMSGSKQNTLKSSGQQESRNPEASSFCNMLRRLRRHTTRIHSLKQHCIPPSTKAEAPCRKTLSFPAAEASLEDSHAPSREQPLTSGRGLRRREKLIVRDDAATGKCFLLSSTTTMQSLFMSGSAIRNRAAHTVGSGASGLWDHAELHSGCQPKSLQRSASLPFLVS